jgi:hypothetical protein
MKVTALPIQPRQKVRASQHSMLLNPGQLYNAGNALAIFGSLLSCAVLAGIQKSSVAYGIGNFFFGSLPAFLATLASVIFWVSGMKYAEAWKYGFPPMAKANAAGHALSTFGALLIGMALMAMARSEVALALAIVATILHVGGKWGSWTAPGSDTYFKPMPFYSRVPYVTSLCLDIRSDWLHSAAVDGVPQILLPLGLIFAAAFWARADWCLLQKS